MTKPTPEPEAVSSSGGTTTTPRARLISATETDPAGVETAYAALEGRLHRTPTEPEVAQELGISLEDLHAIFSQVSFVNVVALDELLNVGGERGDKLSLVDTLDDTKAEDPVMAFETEETKYLLAKAINTLPEREKIVVTLYYYEGLTLAEIGQV